MNLGLDSKLALVCAGSRGLGRAVAIELAREGAEVAFCARSPEGIAAAAEAITAVNDRGALGVIADVGVPADLDAMVDEVIAEFGRTPDIVVWNGGGPPPGPLLELPADALEEGARVHLFGAAHLFRRTIPAMVERGWGRVIAITSVAVKQPLAGLGISNAVRAGLTGLLKTLAAEVGASGVTVNSVLPGYTLTDRLLELAASKAESANTTPSQILDSFAAAVPARRLGRPDELAAAVCFLASDLAGYINGVSLPVDGGFCGGLL